MKNIVVETKSGWIDLRNLVINNKSQIDWGKSIGKTIDFKYHNVVSTLTITGRAENVQYVYIDIPKYVEHYRIHVCQLKLGQFGGALNIITAKFRYNTGDVVNGLLITGRRNVSNHKYYDYCCTKDGFEGSIREDHLMKNHGCPVCVGKQVLKGYNDIATTRPDMAILFLDIDDTYKYMAHSSKWSYFKCPLCGNIIYANINQVSYHGLSCKKCGDGISYPNKFIYNLIEQVSNLHRLNGDALTFLTEKKFDWSMNFEHTNKNLSGNKIYDMYIYECNIIIENHGDYHYRKSAFNMKDARTFEEVQENDRIKRNLALSNGIEEDHYIVLDCYKSEMLYIKNSVMSSNLPMLLNFTEGDIDWNECNRFATYSRVYEACEYWNNGTKDYKHIALNMRMHKNTIQRYIKKGKELGIVVV